MRLVSLTRRLFDLLFEPPMTDAEQQEWIAQNGLTKHRLVTEAEQAVLDACKALKLRYDGTSGDLVVSGDFAVYAAELARRGLT